MHVIALSGSLRKDSTNTAVLRAAVELAPASMTVDIHDLRDLPMYDGDLEADGPIRPVVRLREALAAADGLLIATPEYNRSVPAVMKNAIDWASRGPDSPLTDLPTVIASASGGSGGRFVADHLVEVFAHNKVDLLEDRLLIARSRDHVRDGRLVTSGVREDLASLLEALAARIRARRDVAA